MVSQGVQIYAKAGYVLIGVCIFDLGHLGTSKNVTYEIGF